ncbi:MULTISPECIES: hypothetical protein [Microcoleaceae]|uniref:hypothetical protein n=1 Tax=Microcoleaceae TaxID=1892252 RepID=UPI001D14B40C|nr:MULTISPECIES: hypothetical protein [unclassified Tychonema]
MINTAAAVMTTAAKPNIKNPRWRDKMTIRLEIAFGILELDFGGWDGLDLFLSATGEGFGALESGRSSA